MSSGILLVLSAPSGGGKTTILKKVMADLPGLVFSVSHTTRKPRPGEEDGRDYYFVSRQEFENIRDRHPSGFLEWAEVHGNLYGTSRAAVEQRLGAGRDVVLDIDVQGAAQIRKSADSVTVFIAPPSLAELEARLRGRGTEDEQSLALRLENAKQELAAMDRYDYLVVNDRLDEAVESLRSIIIAERCRRRRAVDGAPVRVNF
ncbi:Guanylate kinase [hydrothermal vent metagenome]|uniref:guanylate kinase n=1 Tax=hydrothermal vent metagenome TaxID=652676 RepID=A0A3B0VMX4_9ZZZZ